MDTDCLQMEMTMWINLLMKEKGGLESEMPRCEKKVLDSDNTIKKFFGDIYKYDV